MGKGYELADGSLSTDYEIGDKFVVNSRVDEQASFSKGSIINFYRDDDSEQPLFNLIKGDCNFNNCRGNKGAFVWWFCLTPTPETKRKAQARKRKFTINAGDYIDSREFSRDECERFCELAVECGYNNKEGVHFYRNPELYALGVASGGVGFCLDIGDYGWASLHSSECGFDNNITTQFREFLDKEKGMSKPSWDDAPEWATELRRDEHGTYRFLGDGKITYKDGSHHRNSMGNEVWGELIETRPKRFTKADLKDGMRVLWRDGREFYVCGKHLIRHKSDYNPVMDYSDDLTNNNGPDDFDIMKVTDRDGTVLFEREEEKVTIELTKEQAEQVKRQLGIK